MLFTNLFSNMTYSFLSDSDPQVNQVSIGYNDSQVEETFPEPQPIDPKKDTAYTKVVSVKNNHTVPCYVRVSVGFSDSAIGDHIDYLNLNTTDWIYIAPAQNSRLGGYFYYQNPVAPGTSTRPLFEGIQIRSSWDTSAFVNGDTLKLYVYEESVQKGASSDYLAAWNDFLRT